jgi:hypothetical protein
MMVSRLSTKNENAKAESQVDWSTHVLFIYLFLYLCFSHLVMNSIIFCYNDVLATCYDFI